MSTDVGHPLDGSGPVVSPETLIGLLGRDDVVLGH